MWIMMRMEGKGKSKVVPEFIYFVGCGETEYTWHTGHFWASTPAPDDRELSGKPKYSEIWIHYVHQKSHMT
jgi:hypothetical protein